MRLAAAYHRILSPRSRKTLILSGLAIFVSIWNGALQLQQVSQIWNSVTFLDVPDVKLTFSRVERLSCASPHPVTIANATHVAANNGFLEQPSNGCGSLQRDWSLVPTRSVLAASIETHQSNCSAPIMTFHVDNDFGLGSHLYMWSQALCNAWEKGYRVQTHNPNWLWLDQGYCDAKVAVRSPFLCYFPQSEDRCSGTNSRGLSSFTQNVSDPRNDRLRCSWMKRNGYLADFRAASMEYLFQSLSPIVIQEAQRQIGLLFDHGRAPRDLISVHVRWGDKFWEMDLAPISDYIDAVHHMVAKQGRDNATTSHIYLSTEDPRAAKEFLEAAPPTWNVYVDRTVTELNTFRPTKGNRASWTTRNTKGRAGLVALGSLLVALEADYFVLTTKSNWSRLWNELRKNVIDSRCGNCTHMIDLRPGKW
jgi:hypothetical protein